MASDSNDDLLSVTTDTRSSAPIWLVTCTIAGMGAAGAVQYLMFEDSDGDFAILQPQGEPSFQRRTRGHGRSVSEVAEELFYSSSDLRCRETVLLPGEYHPRVWRNGIAAETIGVSESRFARPAELGELRQRVVAFHRIQQQLAAIFEVVTPTKSHRSVAGEAIGQVLALAAFEVERLLREAYVANTPSPRGRSRLTMDVFHALAAPMRLAEWATRLEFYDEWGEVCPFAAWTSATVPTWWTAYNRRKHDPAGTASSNLENMIACVCAVRVLLEAEFGPLVDDLLPEQGIASIRVMSRPEWSAEELYFPATEAHVLGAFRPRLLLP